MCNYKEDKLPSGRACCSSQTLQLPENQQKNIHVYSTKPKLQLYIACFCDFDSHATELGNLKLTI